MKSSTYAAASRSLGAIKLDGRLDAAEAKLDEIRKARDRGEQRIRAIDDETTETRPAEQNRQSADALIAGMLEVKPMAELRAERDRLTGALSELASRMLIAEREVRMAKTALEGSVIAAVHPIVDERREAIGNLLAQLATEWAELRAIADATGSSVADYTAGEIGSALKRMAISRHMAGLVPVSDRLASADLAAVFKAGEAVTSRAGLVFRRAAGSPRERIPTRM